VTRWENHGLRNDLGLSFLNVLVMEKSGSPGKSENAEPDVAFSSGVLLDAGPNVLEHVRDVRFTFGLAFERWMCPKLMQKG